MPLPRPLLAFCLAALCLFFSACGGSNSYSGGGGNMPTAPSVQTQPSNQSVTSGQTATFSVAANGTAPLTYQWQKGTSAISGANTASYTTPATQLTDSGSQFSVIITNAAGNVTSNTATLTVTTATGSTDVLTYHNDIARTGQNLAETILTTSNVVSSTFGKLGAFTTANASIDAEPLYASAVTVAGNKHNVLIVAAENDTVYAFDADSPGTAPLWSTNLLQSSETTSDTRSCDQVNPQIGVTSTPVIDRSLGPNGVVYVVAMSKNSSGTYFQRLHALDLALGTEMFGGPVEIQATYPGTGDNSNGTDVDLRSRAI